MNGKLGFLAIPYPELTLVISLSSFSAFASLQSRVHEIFARFFGSSMKDDLRYTPSICFETFPFPENWETDPTLEAVGKAYYDYRADLMVRNNQGLTDTYNCFHDPEERHPDILKLRDLHKQMDRAVLNAYGWHDILGGERSRTPLRQAQGGACGFALDYLDTNPADAASGGRPEAAERVASGDLFFATPDEAATFDSLAANSPDAIAGPKPPPTKSSPASSTSTKNATKKK